MAFQGHRPITSSKRNRSRVREHVGPETVARDDWPRQRSRVREHVVSCHVILPSALWVAGVEQ